MFVCVCVCVCLCVYVCACVCVCVCAGWLSGTETSVLVCSEDPLDDDVADLVEHRAVVCAAYEELVLYQ